MHTTYSNNHRNHNSKLGNIIRSTAFCVVAGVVLSHQTGFAQSGPAQNAHPIQTYGTGYVHVPAVGRHCNDNSCGVRVLLHVELPEGANVVAIRYYTTAGGEEGDHALRAVNPGDIGWSYMEPALTRHENGKLYIETVYYNRSDGRNREAALEVDAVNP
jgi:hypothetical protein